MIPDNLLRVSTPGVNFHVLRDQAGLHLIDAGFIAAEYSLLKALRQRGWENENIAGIIVTHGHLDHILNVKRIADKHGAWIAAPRLDAAHYAGKARYHGLSHVAGVLEGIGKPLLGFRPFTPDRLLDDGDLLDVWDGLRAVHLPGHTFGHTGFFCERHKLLFSADIFASFGTFSHLSLPCLNSCEEMIAGSVCKALSLGATGVLPNHGNAASPEAHLNRLRSLALRFPGKTQRLQP
jgi:glyoxylase-like metal-dependent hydrolase (beta-lactamase superfamily II)